MTEADTEEPREFSLEAALKACQDHTGTQITPSSLRCFKDHMQPMVQDLTGALLSITTCLAAVSWETGTLIWILSLAHWFIKLHHSSTQRRPLACFLQGSCMPHVISPCSKFS